jgi:UDP-glucose 4-epimerase
MINTLHISEIASETTYIPRLENIRPRIWVTAANSFIARNILEQLDYDFIATTHNQIELTDFFSVDRFLHDEYFDYVIHTACIGGRSDKEPQSIFDDNYNMFENLLNQQHHYKYLINFGSGADRTETWYGKAKRVIKGIIKEHDNMINLRLFGVWGKYEKPDRFPTTCIMSDEVTIEDKLMRYIHVDDLVKIVDGIIKDWPKKRDMTLGEPILLSEFARQLNPNIKVIVKGRGKDYV